MSNYDDRRGDKHGNLAVALILIGISTLMLLILCGVFNPAGKYVKDFLLGSFGLSFYGLCVAGLVIGVLKLFKFRASTKLSRIFEVIGIYSLFILAFHATSYDYMSMSTGFSDYIMKCYNGADTAGGVIAGVIMYPLLKVNYAFSIVVVSLLLFALLAVTMFAGKIDFKGNRSHSVRYSGKRRKQDDTHVQVDTSLHNEDVDGNELKDIKARSRFSKAPVMYTPIEEEVDLSDEDVQVEYKDRFACNYGDMSDGQASDVVIEDSISSDAEDDVQPTSRFSSTEEQEAHRRAEEALYGSSEPKVTPSQRQPMTDQQQFLEAVERIRNNEDTNFVDNYTVVNDADYELYTTQGRDRVQRENMRKAEEESGAEASSVSVDDIVEIEDINEDEAEADTIEDATNEVIDDSITPTTTQNEVTYDDLSEPTYSTQDDDYVAEDTDAEVAATDSEEIETKDESVTYDIDDFESSLDKVFPIDNPRESKYDSVHLSSSSFSDSSKEDDYDDDMTASDETVDIDDDNALDDIDDIVEDAVEVEEVAAEELEEEPKRKRRSDFGGTHQSQHPTEELDGDADSTQDTATASVSEDADISGFVNPFAGKEDIPEQEEVEEEDKVDPQKLPPYLVDRGYKYKAPPMSLLKDYVFEGEESNKQEIEEQCRLIDLNLKSFGIPATVQNVVVGPSFSRIELAMEMGAGKSVKAIKTLSSDIELWLGCEGHVNILAPIPGKSAIGIEVPISSKNRRTVGLKEVFNSPVFNNPKNIIPFALGVDIENKTHVCDLQDAPHLLIAGTTGSGKSVGIACLLNSILYKCSPEDVKIILIDPKKVELNDYEFLPHMLIPKPVCDFKQVINVLDWLIDEMERRYNALAKVHASSISDYNEFAEENGWAKKMPYILLVMDEVADLMLELKKDLEDRINKLTAKSRAAGIHLVLATQRPSVDIITGSIKANLPTQVAFATSRSEDSRTIIGTNGAEKLLGKGDMLFLKKGTSIPVRIQCGFIQKKEILAITKYIRDNNKCNYDESIQEFIEHNKEEEEQQSSQSQPSKVSTEDTTAVDERFVEALEAVINAQSASISLLQRKLGIGYPRAGKIYDQLEKFGYIKDKKVLITHMQFMKLFGDQLNGGDGNN